MQIDYKNPPVSDLVLAQQTTERKAISLCKAIAKLPAEFDKVSIALDRVPGCSGPTLVWLARAQEAASQAVNYLGAAHLEMVRYLEGEEAGGGKARALIEKKEYVDALGYNPVYP